MKRFWIVTVIVLAMLMTALPASAKKPDNPGKPPPAEPTLYDVVLEFVPGAEGLSTMADPSCGFADSIVMEWDGRALVSTFDFDEASVPMLDVNLGPELVWYRDYRYIPSEDDVPADFEPPVEPARFYGQGITGCHGAGINVYVDFYGPGDHKYETNTGRFVLALTDGQVNLLWHSDYYIPFVKVTKKKRVSWDRVTIEDFTYSGDLTWTNGEEDVVFDPVNGGSGLVSGNLEVTHFSPGTYDPFPGSPRPVEFILTVTPQS
jgi:hypothetical protein